MTTENPTGDAGASTLGRIEQYLAASEGETTQPQQAQPEPPKEDIDPPAEETPEAVAEEPAGDDSESSEEPQISLSDVAKYLGVDESALDVSEDGAILVKTKIDGKEGAAKFDELLKSYQVQGHADAKAREAAEQAKALQERVSQFEEYAKTEAQKFAQLANVAQQELMRDAAAINWDEMARNDPAGYVQKQHEFQQRQARVQQMIQQAQQTQTHWQQVTQQRQDAALKAEYARMVQLIPEWGDDKARAAGTAEMGEWLTKQGVNPQWMGNLTDAAVVKLLRSAMLAEKSSDQKSLAEKKVRTAPKLVKPGQSQDPKQRAQSAIRDLKQTIQKSGGRTGIAEYLMATGKV